MFLSTQGITSPDDLGASILSGRYHAVIKAVDESQQRNAESIVVEFEIFDGTMPGQKGKTHREFFPTSEKALDRLKRLALVTGLMRPNDTAQVRFSDAIGRQLVILLEEHEWKGKKRVQISWVGMWALDHPDVKDVPKDQEMLKVHRVAPAGAPAAAGNQAPTQGATQAPAAAAANTGDGGWGDV